MGSADGRVVCCWSSGKDSAFALEEALRQGLNVVGLLCTVNSDVDRVAMHAVRRELLEAQAQRLGLPLSTVEIPMNCSHELYAELMQVEIARAAEEEVTGMIFGDLFLEDVREYRIQMLRGSGIEPIFPLWGRETSLLAEEMITSGVKAIITCVDPNQLDATFVGRDFNGAFLDDLPRNVDRCGENGEFHSFVYDAPSFSAPIAVESGVVVERGGFVFADVDLRASVGTTA